MHSPDDQDSPKTSFKPDITILSLVSGTFENDVARIWGDAHLHEYLAASNRRRHVWHCWLSRSVEHDDPYNLLTFSKAREIITLSFGNCPQGLIGALSRLGPVARDPAFYHQLFRCFEKGGSIA